MKTILSIFISLIYPAIQLWANEDIQTFPSSAYDRSGLYLNLAIFWIALIILIFLIRLKLQEIERVQAMDKKQDPDIPTLE